MALVVRNLLTNAGDARDSVRSLGGEWHLLKKAMATHSNILGWRITGTEEPGGLLSMGLNRVKHD